MGKLPIRRGVAVTITVWWLCLQTFGISQEIDREPGQKESASLLVVVLEAKSAFVPPEDGYRIIHLPSAEFPEQLSRLLSPADMGSQFRRTSLALEGTSNLLDLNTYEFEKTSLEGLKPFKQRNDLTGLTYELRLLDWGSEIYELKLNGNYRGVRFKDWFVEAASRRTTVLLTKGPKASIIFAFTPTERIPAIAEGKDKGIGEIPGLVSPKPIEQTIPSIPEVLIDDICDAGTQLVLASVYITLEGRVDPTRFVVTRCPHALLCQTSLKVLLREWEFEPGRVEGQPVEIFAQVDFSFEVGGSPLKQ